jgi:phage terminase large subunit-like protein
MMPSLAIDADDTIHVVWHELAPGAYEIYYKRSVDGGTTWSAAQRLTWMSGASYYPAMAIDSGNTIHVVWQDSAPGDVEIYYKGSTYGGTAWSAAQRLTWMPRASYYPTIANGSGNTVHVVWFDDAPGRWEIYYKGSTDGGTTWSVAQRLTWTSGTSYYPTIAIDSGNTIHVVWEDYTPGYSEIYYKGSTDGGTTWSAAKRLT